MHNLRINDITVQRMCEEACALTSGASFRGMKQETIVALIGRYFIYQEVPLFVRHRLEDQYKVMSRRSTLHKTNERWYVEVVVSAVESLLPLPLTPWTVRTHLARILRLSS